MTKGKLIVTEGIDGSGKTVQSRLLLGRLEKEGFVIANIDFPRYGEPPTGDPVSHFVRKFLRKPEFGFKNGYGDLQSVSPYAAATCYAIDRFDACNSAEDGDNLRQLLDQGYVIVSNRYTQSNIGHQASRISDPTARAEFIAWLYDFEYGRLGICEPDLVVLLDIPVEIAILIKEMQRVEQELQRDILESDSGHLEKAKTAYLEAAVMFSDSWRVVPVTDDTRGGGLESLLTEAEVHDRIWSHVAELLEIS